METEIEEGIEILKYICKRHKWSLAFPYGDGGKADIDNVIIGDPDKIQELVEKLENLGYPKYEILSPLSVY